MNGPAGDIATVVVEQAGIYSMADDENSGMDDLEYVSFITDWENQEFITVNNRKVATPWNSGMAETSLPITVSTVKKEDGWEMAFNSITKDSRCNYFGVYNKYLGILRIFNYNEDYVSSGSEWIFKAYLQEQSKPASFQSLYHSMAFGIPANHQNVECEDHYDRTYRLKNENMLTQAVNPYGGSKSSAPQVSLGWTAFDIDMSHYRPGMYPDSEVDKVIHTDADQLVILNQSCNLTTTNLMGTLIAQAKGNLDGNMNMTTTSSNGLNAWAAENTVSENLGNAFNAIMSGDYLGALKGGLGAIYNQAMIMSGKTTDDYESNGTFTGALTMETSGEIDMQGFSMSNNGNTRDLRVGLAQSAEHTRSHLGKGVWGLLSDPVLYVAKDYICGVNKRFLLTVDEQKGVYSSSTNPADMALQLITCPDPSTLKVAISPVLKGVTDINVTWTWGVYADYTVGHSENFRDQTVKLPYPGLPLDSKHTPGDSYGAYSGSDTKMYYRMIKQPKGQLYTMPDKKHHVWGELLTTKTVFNNDRFVHSPQIYVPFTTEGKYELYDPTFPDPVFCVTLTFDFKDEKGIVHRAALSKRFVPKIVPVTLKELKEKMNSDEMKRYMKPNAEVDGIGYPSANSEMAPSLSILNQL